MIEGFSFKLREVTFSDVDFILNLRNDESLNRFINSTSNKVKDQIEWISKYQKRHDDFYFVVENLKTTESEGLISVYDINKYSKCGEWGRWIMRPGSLAVVESVYLIFKFSFEFLNLSNLFSRTVCQNSNVVNFHDNYGAQRSKLLNDYFMINGSKYDAIEHKVSHDDWNENISPKLEQVAVKISKRI